MLGEGEGTVGGGEGGEERGRERDERGSADTGEGTAVLNAPQKNHPRSSVALPLVRQESTSRAANLPRATPLEWAVWSFLNSTLRGGYLISSFLN